MISYCKYISLLCSKQGQSPKGGVDMHQYELGIVFVPTLSEEEKLASLEKVKELVARFGGKVTKVDDWGKRKLAYEINKIREGFYYFIEFNSNGDAPNEIESRLRIMESVLRYLFIRLDEE